MIAKKANKIESIIYVLISFFTGRIKEAQGITP